MPQYIFIYNQSGVGPNSRDDLKELFTQYPIYADSNVQLSDFNGSFDGLTPQQITLVLPGGTVPSMSAALRPHQERIKSLFAAGSHGLFICAGAYLAVGEANVYYDDYTKQSDRNTFAPMRFWVNTSEQQMSLNIMPEYRAFGSFIPNDSYLDHPAKNLKSGTLKPYLTNLFFSNKQRCSRELFIAGCGFERPREQTDTVATYTDKDQYSFFSPRTDHTKIIHNMAAIVKKPSMIASGVHIEACVENSKLLKLMTEGRASPNGTVLPLLEETSYDAESSRASIIPLLQDAFRQR